MNLGALGLVAAEADLRLSVFREYGIALNMDLVASRAGHIAALMLAPHPIGALAVLMTPETGLGLQIGGRLRAVSEINVYQRTGRGPFGILDMRFTRAVAGLAARSPGVRFDSVGRPVNGENRLRLGLVMTLGTDPISLESSVRLVCPRHQCGTNSQQQKQQESAQ